MNRIDRLTAIIIFLQTKQYIKAEEIAEKFEMSIRTVYRDIRALEYAGVPIGVDNRKGYFIVEGYHLPPVMFTSEEATAMLLAEKVLERFSDNSITSLYQSALNKIKSVLRKDIKQDTETLTDYITITPHNHKSVTSGAMLDILKAIKDKKKILIDYHSLHKNETTSGRKLDPIGLLYYSMDWHLIAFCEMRNDYRDFKVSRIKGIKITNENAAAHDGYSINNYFESMFKKEALYKVIVKFDKSVLKYINTAKYYYGWLSEQETDSGLEVTFATDSYEYISRWLLTYIDTAEVLFPDTLRNKMIEFAEKIQKKYIS